LQHQISEIITRFQKLQRKIELQIEETGCEKVKDGQVDKCPDRFMVHAMNHQVQVLGGFINHSQSIAQTPPADYLKQIEDVLRGLSTAEKIIQEGNKEARWINKLIIEVLKLRDQDNVDELHKDKTKEQFFENMYSTSAIGLPAGSPEWGGGIRGLLYQNSVVGSFGPELMDNYPNSKVTENLIKIENIINIVRKYSVYALNHIVGVNGENIDVLKTPLTHDNILRLLQRPSVQGGKRGRKNRRFKRKKSRKKRKKRNTKRKKRNTKRKKRKTKCKKRKTCRKR